MNEFFIPEYARRALEILEQNGYSAYLVGGCVRDTVMGKAPNDYDITTNALPKQIIDCFKNYNVIKTGLQHGTVTVIIMGEQIEITTFRIDGSYSDNRRPDSVTFSDDIKNDLARRDFTVNAMAYSPTRGFVDFYGGAQDIKNRRIMCVGNADTRFKEDSLRILRAMRFCASLEFEVEGETLAAAHNNRKLLKNISVERIYSELLRTVTQKRPFFALWLFKYEIRFIIPEFCDFTDEKLKFYFGALDDINNEKCVRLAVLFLPLGEEKAKNVLLRLKVDKKTINSVGAIIKTATETENFDRITARKILNKLSFNEAMQACDVMLAVCPQNKSNINLLRQNLTFALKNGDCVKINMLKINGNELKNIGISGTNIGATLEFLLNAVMCEKIKNEPQALISEAEKIYKQGVLKI